MAHHPKSEHLLKSGGMRILLDAVFGVLLAGDEEGRIFQYDHNMRTTCYVVDPDKHERTDTILADTWYSEAQGLAWSYRLPFNWDFMSVVDDFGTCMCSECMVQ